MYNILESFFRGVVMNAKSHLGTLFGESVELLPCQGRIFASTCYDLSGGNLGYIDCLVASFPNCERKNTGQGSSSL